MLDRYWYGSVDRISPESPVPIVEVKQESYALGGAANVAANVAGLGAKVNLLSIIGDDDAGSRLVNLCNDAGIDASLEVDRRVRTTEKLRIVARNQQLLRADFEAVPSHEVLNAIMGRYQKQLPQADVVLLSDYGKGGLTHIRGMIDEARKFSRKVVVDPKGNDFSRYRGATMVTPNLKEFQLAGGYVDDEDAMAESAVRLIKQNDFESLLVTRSEQGMTLYDQNGTSFHSPANSREVFDVSGAGDTVAAIISVGIAAGMDTQNLLELANLAAGCVVSKFGTVAITRDELKVLGICWSET